MPQRNAQQGFTLVEIAIVMVIIGLLLGGALKGQQMIESARVKNLIRFHDEVKAAYYFYQDMYRYLPGDDPGADRFDAVADDEVGNGDGTVEGNWRNRASTQESVRFWQHLVASGLIGIPMPDESSEKWGLKSRVPENVFGGVAGFEYNTEEMGIPVLCFNNLSPEVATKIDLATDDGDIHTGTVYATNMGVKNKIANSAAFSTNDHALCFEF